MSDPTIIKKSYINHFGLDLRSSDLNRPIEFARRMQNAQYRESGSPEKVKGWQWHAESAGGYGFFIYNRINPSTGLPDTRIVSVDQNLNLLNTTSLLVTYSGAESNAIISVFVDPDTSTYKCQIDEGLVTVLDMDLGLGFDELTPVTIDDLAVAINAITNFTASVTGDDQVPAAFLKIVRAWDLAASGGPWTGYATYWTEVNTPLANPFNAHFAQRNSEMFENASAVEVDNVLYFGTGYTDTLKYDGQNLYRAGLPTPASIAHALVGGGSITGNNYFHKAQYIQHDAAGNIISGNTKLTSSGLNAAGDSIDVTVSNIEDTTGFNTNCAIVDGAQAVVNTITVDDGSAGTHTMKVGDTAYFYDGVSASYVEREVTAISATDITVAGAAVTVADNDVISNNLRIAIYRNQTSAITPTVFYLVAEIPNNSFAATQVYNDDIVDASLGAEFIEPVTDRSPPPRGKYISQWNGCSVIGGNLTFQSTLYWSDSDGFEYWPNDGFHEFDIQTGLGDTIRGIGQNNEVFTVHGETCFTVVSGDIITNQLRFETKSKDVGCAAHASIKELDGVLIWLSPKGPRASQGGQVPIPLGPHNDQSNVPPSESRIDPVFNNAGRIEQEKLWLRRATAVIDGTKGFYILFVPAESENGGERYANENSRIFAYQKARDAWLEWANRNMASGAVVYRSGEVEEFYFQERSFTEFGGGSKTYKMARRHNLEDAWDYADNVDPVEWNYSPQWEFLGEASQLKSVDDIKVFNLEEISNNEFQITVKQETNFISDLSKAEFDMTLPGGGYGSSEYSVDAYGDPAEGSAIHSLNRDRMRAISPVFENDTIHQNVILTGWEIGFKANYRPEVKKP